MGFVFTEYSVSFAFPVGGGGGPCSPQFCAGGVGGSGGPGGGGGSGGHFKCTIFQDELCLEGTLSGGGGASGAFDDGERFAGGHGGHLVCSDTCVGVGGGGGKPN